MDKRLKKSFSLTSTVLDVILQVVLSLLKTDDSVLQLRNPAGIDPSCILVATCHAYTCRRGRRDWTGRALKRPASAAHREISETAPVVLFSLRQYACGMTR